MQGQRIKINKAPGSGLFSTPGCPGSIVSAEAFHFRVRDGNGWFHLALATRSLINIICVSGRRSFLRPLDDMRLVAGVGLEPTTSGL